jgi:hypothetical protein
VAVLGAPDAPDTRALLAEVRRAYRPHLVLAVSGSPDTSAIPLLLGRTRLQGSATAFVCRGFACQSPVTDPAALAEQLSTAER